MRKYLSLMAQKVECKGLKINPRPEVVGQAW